MNERWMTAVSQAKTLQQVYADQKDPSPSSSSSAELEELSFLLCAYELYLWKYSSLRGSALAQYVDIESDLTFLKGYLSTRHDGSSAAGQHGKISPLPGGVEVDIHRPGDLHENQATEYVASVLCAVARRRLLCRDLRARLDRDPKSVQAKDSPSVALSTAHLETMLRTAVDDTLRVDGADNREKEENSTIGSQPSAAAFSILLGCLWLAHYDELSRIVIRQEISTLSHILLSLVRVLCRKVTGLGMMIGRDPRWHHGECVPKRGRIRVEEPGGGGGGEVAQEESASLDTENEGARMPPPRGKSAGLAQWRSQGSFLPAPVQLAISFRFLRFALAALAGSLSVPINRLWIASQTPQLKVPETVSRLDIVNNDEHHLLARPSRHSAVFDAEELDPLGMVSRILAESYSVWGSAGTPGTERPAEPSTVAERCPNGGSDGVAEGNAHRRVTGSWKTTVMEVAAAWSLVSFEEGTEIPMTTETAEGSDKKQASHHMSSHLASAVDGSTFEALLTVAGALSASVKALVTSKHKEVESNSPTFKFDIVKGSVDQVRLSIWREVLRLAATSLGVLGSAVDSWSSVNADKTVSGQATQPGSTAETETASPPVFDIHLAGCIARTVSFLVVRESQALISELTLVLAVRTLCLGATASQVDAMCVRDSSTAASPFEDATAAESSIDNHPRHGQKGTSRKDKAIARTSAFPGVPGQLGETLRTLEATRVLHKWIEAVLNEATKHIYEQWFENMQKDGVGDPSSNTDSASPMNGGEKNEVRSDLKMFESANAERDTERHSYSRRPIVSVRVSLPYREPHGTTSESATVGQRHRVRPEKAADDRIDGNDGYVRKDLQIAGVTLKFPPKTNLQTRVIARSRGQPQASHHSTIEGSPALLAHAYVLARRATAESDRKLLFAVYRVVSWAATLSKGDSANGYTAPAGEKAGDAAERALEISHTAFNSISACAAQIFRSVMEPYDSQTRPPRSSQTPTDDGFRQLSAPLAPVSIIQGLHLLAEVLESGNGFMATEGRRQLRRRRQRWIRAAARVTGLHRAYTEAQYKAESRPGEQRREAPDGTQGRKTDLAYDARRCRTTDKIGVPTGGEWLFRREAHGHQDQVKFAGAEKDERIAGPCRWCSSDLSFCGGNEAAESTPADGDEFKHPCHHGGLSKAAPTPLPLSSPEACPGTAATADSPRDMSGARARLEARQARLEKAKEYPIVLSDSENGGAAVPPSVRQSPYATRFSLRWLAEAPRTPPRTLGVESGARLDPRAVPGREELVKVAAGADASQRLFGHFFLQRGAEELSARSSNLLCLCLRAMLLRALQASVLARHRLRGACRKRSGGSQLPFELRLPLGAVSALADRCRVLDCSSGAKNGATVREGDVSRLLAPAVTTGVADSADHSSADAQGGMSWGSSDEEWLEFCLWNSAYAHVGTGTTEKARLSSTDEQVAAIQACHMLKSTVGGHLSLGEVVEQRPPASAFPRCAADRLDPLCGCACTTDDTNAEFPLALPMVAEVCERLASAASLMPVRGSAEEPALVHALLHVCLSVLARMIAHGGVPLVAAILDREQALYWERKGHDESSGSVPPPPVTAASAAATTCAGGLLRSLFSMVENAATQDAALRMILTVLRGAVAVPRFRERWPALDTQLILPVVDSVTLDTTRLRCMGRRQLVWKWMALIRLSVSGARGDEGGASVTATSVASHTSVSWLCTACRGSGCGARWTAHGRASAFGCRWLQFRLALHSSLFVNLNNLMHAEPWQSSSLHAETCRRVVCTLAALMKGCREAREAYRGLVIKPDQRVAYGSLSPVFLRAERGSPSAATLLTLLGMAVDEDYTVTEDDVATPAVASGACDDPAAEENKAPRCFPVVKNTDALALALQLAQHSVSEAQTRLLRLCTALLTGGMVEEKERSAETSRTEEGALGVGGERIHKNKRRLWTSVAQEEALGGSDRDVAEDVWGSSTSGVPILGSRGDGEERSCARNRGRTALNLAAFCASEPPVMDMVLDLLPQQPVAVRKHTLELVVAIGCRSMNVKQLRRYLRLLGESLTSHTHTRGRSLPASPHSAPDERGVTDRERRGAGGALGETTQDACRSGSTRRKVEALSGGGSTPGGESTAYFSCLLRSLCAMAASSLANPSASGGGVQHSGEERGLGRSSSGSDHANPPRHRGPASYFVMSGEASKLFVLDTGALRWPRSGAFSFSSWVCPLAEPALGSVSAQLNAFAPKSKEKIAGHDKDTARVTEVGPSCALQDVQPLLFLRSRLKSKGSSSGSLALVLVPCDTGSQVHRREGQKVVEADKGATVASSPASSKDGRIQEAATGDWRLALLLRNKRDQETLVLSDVRLEVGRWRHLTLTLTSGGGLFRRHAEGSLFVDGELRWRAELPRLPFTTLLHLQQCFVGALPPLAGHRVDPAGERAGVDAAGSSPARRASESAPPETSQCPGLNASYKCPAVSASAWVGASSSYYCGLLGTVRFHARALNASEARSLFELSSASDRAMTTLGGEWFALHPTLAATRRFPDGTLSTSSEATLLAAGLEADARDYHRHVATPGTRLALRRGPHRCRVHRPSTGRVGVGATRARERGQTHAQIGEGPGLRTMERRRTDRKRRRARARKTDEKDAGIGSVAALDSVFLGREMTTGDEGRGLGGGVGSALVPMVMGASTGQARRHVRTPRARRVKLTEDPQMASGSGKGTSKSTLDRHSGEVANRVFSSSPPRTRALAAQTLPSTSSSASTSSSSSGSSPCSSSPSISCHVDAGPSPHSSPASPSPHSSAKRGLLPAWGQRLACVWAPLGVEGVVLRTLGATPHATPLGQASGSPSSSSPASTSPVVSVWSSGIEVCASACGLVRVVQQVAVSSVMEALGGTSILLPLLAHIDVAARKRVEAIKKDGADNNGDEAKAKRQREGGVEAQDLLQFLRLVRIFLRNSGLPALCVAPHFSDGENPSPVRNAPLDLSRGAAVESGVALLGYLIRRLAWARVSEQAMGEFIAIHRELQASADATAVVGGVGGTDCGDSCAIAKLALVSHVFLPLMRSHVASQGARGAAGRFLVAVLCRQWPENVDEAFDGAAPGARSPGCGELSSITDKRRGSGASDSNSHDNYRNSSSSRSSSSTSTSHTSQKNGNVTSSNCSSRGGTSAAGCPFDADAWKQLSGFAGLPRLTWELQQCWRSWGGDGVSEASYGQLMDGLGSWIAHEFKAAEAVVARNAKDKSTVGAEEGQERGELTSSRGFDLAEDDGALSYLTTLALLTTGPFASPVAHSDTHAGAASVQMLQAVHRECAHPRVAKGFVVALGALLQQLDSAEQSNEGPEGRHAGDNALELAVSQEKSLMRAELSPQVTGTDEGNRATDRSPSEAGQKEATAPWGASPARGTAAKARTGQGQGLCEARGLAFSMALMGACGSWCPVTGSLALLAARLLLHVDSADEEHLWRALGLARHQKRHFYWVLAQRTTERLDARSCPDREGYRQALEEAAGKKGPAEEGLHAARLMWAVLVDSSADDVLPHSLSVRHSSATTTPRVVAPAAFLPFLWSVRRCQSPSERAKLLKAARKTLQRSASSRRQLLAGSHDWQRELVELLKQDNASFSATAEQQPGHGASAGETAPGSAAGSAAAATAATAVEAERLLFVLLAEGLLSPVWGPCGTMTQAHAGHHSSRLDEGWQMLTVALEELREEEFRLAGEVQAQDQGEEHLHGQTYGLGQGQRQAQAQAAAFAGAPPLKLTEARLRIVRALMELVAEESELWRGSAASRTAIARGASGSEASWSLAKIVRDVTAERTEWMRALRGSPQAITSRKQFAQAFLEEACIRMLCLLPGELVWPGQPGPPPAATLVRQLCTASRRLLALSRATRWSEVVAGVHVAGAWAAPTTPRDAASQSDANDEGKASESASARRPAPEGDTEPYTGQPSLSNTSSSAFVESAQTSVEAHSAAGPGPFPGDKDGMALSLVLTFRGCLTTLATPGHDTSERAGHDPAASEQEEAGRASEAEVSARCTDGQCLSESGKMLSTLVSATTFARVCKDPPTLARLLYTLALLTASDAAVGEFESSRAEAGAAAGMLAVALFRARLVLGDLCSWPGGSGPLTGSGSRGGPAGPLWAQALPGGAESWSAFRCYCSVADAVRATPEADRALRAFVQACRSGGVVGGGVGVGVDGVGGGSGAVGGGASAGGPVHAESLPNAANMLTLVRSFDVRVHAWREEAAKVRTQRYRQWLDVRSAMDAMDRDFALAFSAAVEEARRRLLPAAHGAFVELLHREGWAEREELRRCTVRWKHLLRQLAGLRDPWGGWEGPRHSSGSGAGRHSHRGGLPRRYESLQLISATQASGQQAKTHLHHPSESDESLGSERLSFSISAPGNTRLDRVFWILDRAETSSRMRLRLKRNRRGNLHLGGVRDDARAGRAPRAHKVNDQEPSASSSVASGSATGSASVSASASVRGEPAAGDERRPAVPPEGTWSVGESTALGGGEDEVARDHMAPEAPSSSASGSPGGAAASPLPSTPPSTLRRRPLSVEVQNLSQMTLLHDLARAKALAAVGGEVIGASSLSPPGSAAPSPVSESGPGAVPSAELLGTSPMSEEDAFLTSATTASEGIHAPGIAWPKPARHATWTPTSHPMSAARGSEHRAGRAWSQPASASSASSAAAAAATASPASSSSFPASGAATAAVLRLPCQMVLPLVTGAGALELGGEYMAFCTRHADVKESSHEKTGPQDALGGGEGGTESDGEASGPVFRGVCASSPHFHTWDGPYESTAAGAGDRFTVPEALPGAWREGVAGLAEDSPRTSGEHAGLRHPRSKRWAWSSLRRILPRTYLQQALALECFFTNGTTVFLAFPDRQAALEAERRMRARQPPNLEPFLGRRPSTILSNSGLTDQWRRREIDNFTYLMQLNTIAGRSYNDLSQYPVFPWVLRDYASRALDLDDRRNYRDLRWPIGAQTEERRRHYRERFELLQKQHQEEAELWAAAAAAGGGDAGSERASPSSSRSGGAAPTVLPAFHFGTHYSTAAFVSWYLLRLEPFTSYHLALQGGRFDHPDRLFTSLHAAFQGVLSNPTDVKELVPEFFYLPEFLSNRCGFDLGATQAGEEVGDVELPPWAESPADFVHKHRAALESEHVSLMLHCWIDLLFGFKQRPPALGGSRACVDAVNVYFHLTYPKAVDLEKLKREDSDLYQATLSQIEDFGQCPPQLLRRPHPQRGPASETVFPLLSQIPRGIPPTEPIPTGFKTYLLPLRAKGSVLFLREDQESLVVADQSAAICLHQWRQMSPDIAPPFHFQKRAEVVNTNKLANEGRTGMWGSSETLRSYSNRHYMAAAAYASCLDSRTLVTCRHWDRSFKVSSLESSLFSVTKTRTVSSHQDIVTCVCVSKDGSVLATGSADTTVKLWDANSLFQSDLPTKTPLVVLTGHDDGVTCVDIDVGLDLVVSASKDGTCILHTVRRGRYLRSLRHARRGKRDGDVWASDLWGQEPLPAVTWVAISSRGEILSYSADDFALSVFSVNGDRLAYVDVNERLNALCLSEDGSSLLVGGDSRCLTVYNVTNLQARQRIDGHSNDDSEVHFDSPITSLSLTKKERHILIGLQSGKVMVMAYDPHYLCDRLQRRLAKLGF